MPSYKLAESIHTKWKQQSGDRGSDLYVATVDDFVLAYIQCSAYSQFLKGDNLGTGPSKEELKLRGAQRFAAKTGISKLLHDAILKMLGGDEWYTMTPHLEKEEVFVFLKRKPNTALNDERKSHRPNKISISRPRVQTRFARLDVSPPPVTIPDSPTTTDEEQLQLPTHDAPQQVDRHHVTAIEETLCNPAQWHIARLPRTSAKACFALQAITNKKCVARIVQYGKSTAAPTYSGFMDNFRKKRLDPQDFFFCNDDIERWVQIRY
jgi:hypothetical protein